MLIRRSVFLTTFRVLPLLPFLLSLPARSHASWPAGAEIERVENSTVYFRAPAGTEPPKPLKTAIHDLRYIGTIAPNRGGTPYLVMVGKPCDDCKADKRVYLLRADGSVATHFVYPGKITDTIRNKRTGRKSEVTVFYGRAFYGKCLPGYDEAYVVHQEERVDRRGIQPSIFVAVPHPDRIEEKLIERRALLRRALHIRNTLRLVKKKQCHEIRGYERPVTAKLLNLRPQRDDENADDEDEDETPKESQTQGELPSPET